jgi:hypothetical protein
MCHTQQLPGTTEQKLQPARGFDIFYAEGQRRYVKVFPLTRGNSSIG